MSYIDKPIKNCKEGKLNNLLVMILTLLVISVTIFGSAASQVILGLESGFVIFVDIVSKIATTGVFFWAVYTHNLNENNRKKDRINLHINELSSQIEETLYAMDFSSSKARLSILIRKIEEMIQYGENLNSDESRRKIKLSLDIIREALKDLDLKPILGIDAGEGFYDNIEVLTNIYSNMESIKTFDERFYGQIQKSIKRTPLGQNFSSRINAPSRCIRPSQLKKIISLVYEISEDDANKWLLEKPKTPASAAYQMPGIFAFYQFYIKGNVGIDENRCVHAYVP